MNKKNISVFKSPLNNSSPLGSASLKDVYEKIKGDSLASQTEFLRAVKNKEDYLLSNFPYVSFYGEYSGKWTSNRDTIKYNGYIVLEFEGISSEEELEESRRHLLTCGAPTHLLYRSALGKGFVWVVMYDLIDYNYYKAAYAYAAELACRNEILKRSIKPYDHLTNKITFVCHDPNVYYVEDGELMNFNEVKMIKNIFDTYPKPNKTILSQEIANIDERVYATMPKYLQELTKKGRNPNSRDVLLLGSLTSISSVFRNVYSVYDNKKLFVNLYFILLGDAGIGKGGLSLCKDLVRDVNEYIKKESGKKSSLFIPGNISSASIYDSFLSNKGHGFIYETECDSVGNALKTDWSDYSTIFRKAFHHEEISKKRKTGSINIENPKLSTLLSGTPNQLIKLIPSSENGLFSRFMYYNMKADLIIANLFSNKDDQISDTIGDLSKELLDIYKKLIDTEVQIYYTLPQQEKIIKIFQDQLEDEVAIYGTPFWSIRIRLIVIFIRISSIFTILRNHNSLEEKMYCPDVDFDNTLLIINVIAKHAAVFFEETPSEKPILNSQKKKKKLYECLPDKFTRQECRNISEGIDITCRTMDRYLSEYLKEKSLVKTDKISYKKIRKDVFQ